jgi:thioredoxin-related protein
VKKFSFVVSLAFLCNYVSAQTDSLPIYKRFPELPPFKLMLAPDSIKFEKADLKKKTATVIMIFSPDCDHCIHATKELLANINLLTKAQIIMATSLSFDHVQKFYTDFKLKDFPNIKAGIDNTYFLATLYAVRSFPSIYVYDKKGKFKAFFEGTVPWEQVAAAMK